MTENVARIANGLYIGFFRLTILVFAKRQKNLHRRDGKMKIALDVIIGKTIKRVNPMKKNYPNNDRDKMIVGGVYCVLANHKGKRNRITREHLREEVDAELYGKYGTIEDRDVRNAIEYLRMTYEGARILSTSGSSGYWMAESLDEFMDCINEDRRRALSILIRIHKQKKAAKKQFVETLPLFEFAEMEQYASL